MKIKQTLENGKHTITRLRWSKINDTTKPIIKLASSDESGTVTIWDTCDNKVFCELKDSNYIIGIYF